MSQTVQASVWAQRFEQEGWATNGPAWLQEARVAAMGRLETIGLPNRRTPGWEHSDASPMAVPRKRSEPGQLDSTVIERAAFQDEAARIVLVDGEFNAKLSRLDDLPEGFAVQDLTEMWGDKAFQDSQEGKLAEADALGCLNLAFLQGGVLLTVAANATTDHPIHIVHVHSRPDTATSTKHVILAGANSKTQVVESWVGMAPGTMSVHTTEIITAPGAKVDHVKQQLEHQDAFHLARVEMLVNKDANAHTFLWSSGAKWSRSETIAKLLHEGAHCSVDGLWLGRRTQMHDTPTTMEHLAAHTTSTELYKGILDESSRGIFLGNVIVAKDAQKVDSQQTNRNLLLSDKARVDTTPQLEIYADDVKCAHGSTIGQLDQEALFFLRARGIDKQRGELLLTKAFAGEALSRVGSWGIRTRLERRLENWFGGRK